MMCSCKHAETRRHCPEGYNKFCFDLKSIRRVATASSRSHILTVLSRLRIE